MKDKNKINPSDQGLVVRKKRVLKALQKSLGVISHACEIADVPRQTFYSWIRKDPQFLKKVNEIEDLTLDFAETKLFQHIENDNITALIFYLKTKGQKRGYIERAQVDVNQRISGEVTHNHQKAIQNLSSDELKQLLELQKKMLNAPEDEYEEIESEEIEHNDE